MNDVKNKILLKYLKRDESLKEMHSEFEDVFQEQLTKGSQKVMCKEISVYIRSMKAIPIKGTFIVSHLENCNN